SFSRRGASVYPLSWPTKTRFRMDLLPGSADQRHREVRLCDDVERRAACENMGAHAMAVGRHPDGVRLHRCCRGQDPVLHALAEADRADFYLGLEPVGELAP